jgi:hypothetical protein
VSLSSKRRVALVTGVGVSARARNRSNISANHPFCILISYRPSDYFLNGRISFFDLIGISHGFERYKDFLISSSPAPTFVTGFQWYSQGTILRAGRLCSIIVVNASQALSLTARKPPSSTGSRYVGSGSTSGLDAQTGLVTELSADLNGVTGRVKLSTLPSISPDPVPSAVITSAS